MASALRSYMGEEITAFQLEETLDQVMNATEDQTVESMGLALWSHYDDLRDHKIVASKGEWEYFNRILLLLESDGEIVKIKDTIRWHVRQFFAAICLGAFFALTLHTGVGWHLVLYAMPFGLVSMVIASWATHRRSRREEAEAFTTPFPSIASLLSVRRRVSGFQRQQYPEAIIDRRIRGRLLETAMRLLWGLMWLMFAPLPLFFQMFPERESETAIRMPEEAAATQ